MCQQCQQQQLKQEFELLLHETTAPANQRKTNFVDAKKVSCARYNPGYPIFKAVGTTDPVGRLEAIHRRAVEMLDNSIGELTRIRASIAAGASISYPLLSDLLAWSLEKRMLVKVSDRAAWTGNGPRSVAQVIRWLKNIRKLIAEKRLWYTCLDTSFCAADTWAWVYKGQLRIYLCRRFWNAAPGVDTKTHFEYQAQTIIHEVSHIFYHTEDSGRGPGAAECVSQFVADANGSPIDPVFEKRCGAKGPAMPAAAKAKEFAGF